jgi:transcriptional pleiotropic regulator of transition state genes
MAVPQVNDVQDFDVHREGMSLRHVDVLGRVVIPKDMRRQAGLEPGDEVALHFIDGEIVISKFAPSCAACGARGSLIEYRHAHLCARCLAELRAG